MYRLTFILVAVLALVTFCYPQDPMPVLRSSWQTTVQKGKKVESQETGPARQMMVEDTLGPRKAREFSTDHPDNPSDQSPDGRRSVIEKNEQEAGAPQPKDTAGFIYSATVRNDGSKTVKVIYWEYRFTEIATPTNIVRRQFLCSVNLKKGAEVELTAFSTQGPTDVINTASLAKADTKLFDEKVQVNRIEYADDDVLQRGHWKLADVKASVDRVTSTPWGKEICRPL